MSANKTNLGQVDTLLLAFTTTPLSGGALYEGEIMNLTGYTHISGFAYSDVASATDGLIIEQGYQPTDFLIGSTTPSLITRSVYSIIAADIDNNAFAVQIVAPFGRIVYVNGAGAQSLFRLYFGARILRGL